MRQDRFLTGILIGIGVIVALALILFFTRSEPMTYTAEDTPQGVLQNYVVAVHRGDYERAYSYMLEGKGKPAYSEFRRVFVSGQLDLSQSGLEIGEVSIDADHAVVSVVTIRGQRPFGEIYRQRETAELKMVDGKWKIKQAPYPYWEWRWLNPDIKEIAP